MFERLYGGKKFNFEHACVAFVTVGFPIFIVNLLSGDFNGALKAGFVQGIFSFFMVGLNTAFFEFLYKKTHKVLAVLLPSLLTTSVSFILHTVNQSPEILLSVLSVFLMAASQFTSLAFLQKRYDSIQYHKLVPHFIAHVRRKR